MSRIILPLLPNPTDIVVQGEMSVFMNMPVAMLNPVLQGEVTTAAMPGFPVPRAMIGQHEWYGLKPRRLDPKVFAGGEVVYLDVGAGPVKAWLDPIQAWINSTVMLDNAGAMMSLGDQAMAAPGQVLNSFIITNDSILDDPVALGLPRTNNVMGNFSGKRGYQDYPDSYYDCETVNGTMVQATQRYVITGQTLNSTGAPLGNCRVVMLDSSRVIAGGDINPVVAETISDGSGNYSIVAPRPVEYQLMAYLPGSPDVAGITRDDVFPAVA